MVPRCEAGEAASCHGCIQGTGVFWRMPWSHVSYRHVCIVAYNTMVLQSWLLLASTPQQDRESISRAVLLGRAAPSITSAGMAPGGC